MSGRAIAPPVTWVLAGCAAIAAVALGASGAGCDASCRRIDITPVELSCTAFLGELHLDDAAVWESFLELECLPEGGREQIDALIEAVSFEEDAIFVAAGPRGPQPRRCIEARAVDVAEVCADGLRLAFRDEVSAADPCDGTWTTAFLLARRDLRAALAIEEDDGP